MAQAPSTASNPFALMMTPEVVLQAMERSERLSSLQRRVCRPLDRPLIPKTDGAADLADFDREVDDTVEEQPED